MTGQNRLFLLRRDTHAHQVGRSEYQRERNPGSERTREHLEALFDQKRDNQGIREDDEPFEFSAVCPGSGPMLC